MRPLRTLLAIAVVPAFAVPTLLDGPSTPGDEARFVEVEGFALVGPDLAGWDYVAVGGPRQPTITIDDQIYPDAGGVEFFLNGEARSSDFEGPRSGGKYRLSPPLELRKSMAVEARWADARGTGHRSIYDVDLGPITSISPAVTTPGTAAPTTDSTSSVPPVTLATWTDVEAGSGRQPTITMDDAVYPSARGVQFLINGSIDDRSKTARAGGWDATGPRDDSEFHVYPDVDLQPGDRLTARWIDLSGTAHEHTHVVASAPSTTAPITVSTTTVAVSPSTTTPTTPSPSTTIPVTTRPSSPTTIAPADDDAATWTDVAAGSRRLPTVTINDSEYPNGKGVQFLINGEIDDRSKTARSGGWDATGPQDDSIFHIYPVVDLIAGDELTARWTDQSDSTYESVHTVGAGTVTGDLPPEAEPTPTTTTPSTSTPPATQPPNPPPPSPSPSSVTHGSQLTVSNTVLRAAGYTYNSNTDTFSHPQRGPLKKSGTIRTSYNGQVIEDVDITGAVIVEHDNVVIRNCRIRYSGTLYGIDARRESPSGTTIEFCDIHNVGSSPHEAIGVFISRGTIRWSNLSTWQTAIMAETNTTIEYNRVTNPKAVAGTHGTAVAVDGGTNILVARNYLLGNTSSTLALYSRRPFNGALVKENFLDAGTTPSFCLNGGNNKNGVGSNRNIQVVGNIFGTSRFPRCGQYGPEFNFSTSAPGAIWCGNRFANTGNKVGSDVGCN